MFLGRFVLCFWESEANHAYLKWRVPHRNLHFSVLRRILWKILTRKTRKRLRRHLLTFRNRGSAEVGLPRVGSAVNLGNWSMFAHTLGARQIGFCHAAHLSNSFKRATGLSPKAWLKS